MHIQVPIDSRNSAIQHAYHILLHPSSSSQPRHPMLKIVVTQRVNTLETRTNAIGKARHSDALKHSKKRGQTQQRSEPDLSSKLWVRHPKMFMRRQQSSTSTQAFTTPNHCAPVIRCANDPSAGSPTETLLRLLLPLSDKVH